MQTQWRSSAFALVGLDYNTLINIAKNFEIKLDRKLFRKIQILEGLSLSKFSKSSDKRNDVKNGKNGSKIQHSKRSKK